MYIKCLNKVRESFENTGTCTYIKVEREMAAHVPCPLYIVGTHTVLLLEAF